MDGSYTSNSKREVAWGSRSQHKSDNKIMDVLRGKDEYAIGGGP